MPLFALVIFLSAFLLFQVQPMIAKVILPWFGSSPGVWTACMMFFQTGLLAGYAYAHGIVNKLSWRKQAVIHITLLAASLAALPIMPDDVWKPTAAGDPTWRIVLMLLACVGAPYLLLASTGPLLQRWFGQLYAGRSPYRLFALSNAGSLAGLLTYPFLFEPQLTLQAQTTSWSFAYGAFAVVCGVVAILLWRSSKESAAHNLANEAAPVSNGGSEGASSTDDDSSSESVRVTGRQIAMWLGLSACGSVMLLSATNLLCQDVAAVPFLWVVPLAVYLLTFIIAFDSPRWYFRPVLMPAALVGAAGMIWVAIDPDGLAQRVEALFSQQVIPQVMIIGAGLFAICMGCHGELARAKPHPSRLTLFYLCVSAGGALGGMFVGLLAPVAFIGYWELPIALVASVLLIGVAASSGTESAYRFWSGAAMVRRPLALLKSVFSRAPIWQPVWLLCVAGVIVAAPFTDPVFRESAFKKASVYVEYVEVRRNFFGVWRTTDVYSRVPVSIPGDSESSADVSDGENTRLVSERRLVHGRILHGFQFMDDELRRTPTTYYGERSGVGQALLLHPRRDETEQGAQASPLRIGVIGLGSGTIASYGRQGDVIRFYEINPLLAQTAEHAFTYLTDARTAGADVQVSLGDARLVLERQAAEEDLQQFDVLAVDAFSGDSIPVHLLTKECYEVYWRHLKPDGVLAIHVSNKYLDLDQVARGLAETDDRQAVAVNFGSTAFNVSESYRLSTSEWVLVTTNAEFLRRVEATNIRTEDETPPSIQWPDENLPSILWTDDFSSLLSVLKDR